MFQEFRLATPLIFSNVSVRIINRVFSRVELYSRGFKRSSGKLGFSSEARPIVATLMDFSDHMKAESTHVSSKFIE